MSTNTTVVTYLELARFLVHTKYMHVGHSHTDVVHLDGTGWQRKSTLVEMCDEFLCGPEDVIKGLVEDLRQLHVET